MYNFKILIFSFLAWFFFIYPVSAQEMGGLVISPNIINEKAQARDILEYTIILENKNQAGKMDVYAVVNDILPDGGIKEFSDPSELSKEDSIARWVKIKRNTIEVAPDERVEVLLSIEVNLSALPGNYYARIGFVNAPNRREAEEKMKTSQQPMVLLNIEVNPDLEKIVPGEKREYTNYIDGLSGLGKYKARLELSYGADNDRDIQDSVYFWVLPWHFFAIFCVLVFLFMNPVLARNDDGLALSITPPLIKNNVNPGQVWKSSIKLINNNSYEIKVYVQVSDFEGGPEEGTVKFISVDPQSGDSGYLMSRWIAIDLGPISIPAFSSKEIPYVVDVPEDATPGGHYAAVMAGTKPGDDSGGGSKISISTMLSSLILLSVSGDIDERGRIREFSTNQQVVQDANIDFAVRFENIGNVHIQPQGEIQIYDFWDQEKGKILINHNKETGNVLPGGIRKWNFNWAGEKGFFRMGRYKAVLILSYGQQGRETVDRTLYFWVLNFKVLAYVFGSIIFLVIVFVIFIGGVFAVNNIINKNKDIKVLQKEKTNTDLPEEKMEEEGDDSSDIMIVDIDEILNKDTQVLNGSGESGVAGTVADILKTSGFKNIYTGNASDFNHNITLIRHTKESVKTAELIANLFSNIVKLELFDNQDGLVVIVGKDFK